MNPLSLLPPPPPSTNFFNDPHNHHYRGNLASSATNQAASTRSACTTTTRASPPPRNTLLSLQPLHTPRTRDTGRVSSPLPPLLFFFRFLFPPFFSSQPRSFFQLSFPLPLASAVVARAKGDKPRHYRVDRHFRHAEDGTSLRVPAASVINPLATLRKYLLLLPLRML